MHYNDWRDRELTRVMVRAALGHDFMDQPGYTVTVDGQYGSTGKGVISGLMAECYADKVSVVLSNAAPNSGHTSILRISDDMMPIKTVLKQLPTFGVTVALLSKEWKMFGKIDGIGVPAIYLTGGAVIDWEKLGEEASAYLRGGFGADDKQALASELAIHPYAAVITPEEKMQDGWNVSSIASTGQGVGPAIMNKLRRDTKFVVAGHREKFEYLTDRGASILTDPNDFLIEFEKSHGYIEVSQGFSLGINSGFYPHTTSRECSVSQAIADAGLSPFDVRNVIMSVRTFPIRVGNTENSSGPYYADQDEMTWEGIGQPEEFTTVTKRVRRIFSWSALQFEHALRANRPNVIFLNFVNYLPNDPQYRHDWIMRNVYRRYCDIMGRLPKAILLGYGPNSEDVRVFKAG